MKKLLLLSFFAIIGVVGLSSNTSIDTINSGDDFSFPEYSDVLYANGSLEGCSATCGTTSCSGSGECVCSCSTLKCNCDATVIGYNDTPKIDVSINEKQYKNLKALAYILYEAKDNNANNAYLHLGNAVEGLKDKDASTYHNERDFYYESLYKISSEDAKTKLNAFFEKVGVSERV